MLNERQEAVFFNKRPLLHNSPLRFLQQTQNPTTDAMRSTATSPTNRPKNLSPGNQHCVNTNCIHPFFCKLYLPYLQIVVTLFTNCSYLINKLYSPYLQIYLQCLQIVFILFTYLFTLFIYLPHLQIVYNLFANCIYPIYILYYPYLQIVFTPIYFFTLFIYLPYLQIVFTIFTNCIYPIYILL